VWKIAQRIGLKGAITHEEEDGSKAQPRLYSEHGRVPKAAAENIFAAFDDALEKAMRWGCRRGIADMPDTNVREALTAVGWPAERNLTPEQRAVEYMAVDWNTAMTPERASLFSYMGDTIECRDKNGAFFLALGSHSMNGTARGIFLIMLHFLRFSAML